jgi:hypothetical protein
MLAFRRILVFCLVSSLPMVAPAQSGQPQQPAEPVSTKAKAKTAPEEAGIIPESPPDTRTPLNLKGQTDAARGENRRNDNIQLNPIDNNALRDVNLRIGVSATLIGEFEPGNRYFGTEYGARPEPPIHIVPNPSAAFHGTLFETHSNSVFNARSFFQVGAVKPAHENNYGFSFGVPFGKSVFLSLDAAQQRARGSVNGNILVPNADERTPLTNDPEIRPIVEGLLAAYPAELPNRPDIDNRALNTNSPQKIDTDRIAGTLSWHFSEKDNLLFRYGLTSQRVDSFQFVAGQNPNSDVYAHAARITWNRTISERTLLESSLGFDRLRTALEPEPHGVGPAISIFIIAPFRSAVIPVNRAINDFQYAARLQQTSNKHTWTVGVDVLRRQFNGREVSGHPGTFFFTDAFGRDAVSNIRMGTPTRYSVTIGETARGYRNLMPRLYGGDRWQVSRNLTVSVGLRYEAVTRPVEVDGLDVIPFRCDCNNFAPMGGFAYKLPGKWGILRSAYGLHYGQILPSTYGQVRFNPPGNIGIVVDVPNLAHPLGQLDLTQLDPNTRSNLTKISADLVVPYSHQYNFSWELSPANLWNIQLGYVGSRTNKVFTSWSTNRAVPVDGIPQTVATVNQRRPDPNYFMIQKIGNGARAYYDAARVTFLMQQWHRWTFDTSYWFSKAIDTGMDYSSTGVGSGAQPQSEQWMTQDSRGLSNFDQPHAWLSRTSYTFPAITSRSGRMRQILGAWTAFGVLLMKSGTPFTAFVGSDAPGFGNVDGESGDRVDILDPSILGMTVGNPDTSTTILRRDAFRFMSPTALRGNIGRNTFRKGGIANVNAALAGTWIFSAEKSLMFRAESVNLFNTPQFADPERNFVSKTFGKISNTLNVGRAFQFTLRFSF